jgi:AcrR family transcriptional regulator
MGKRRDENKRETRQRISDVATEMFCARGFDIVTLDEIAVAASVSKMTVFNYFPRKEDLMLDRNEDLLLIPFRVAIRERPNGQAPVAALCSLLDTLREQKQPFVGTDRRSLGWWRVVAASPSLKARLHEFEDEAAEGLAVELAGPKPDGLARLMAAMVVLTVRTAREEALRTLEHGSSTKKANTTFLGLIDRGFAAINHIAAKSS